MIDLNRPVKQEEEESTGKIIAYVLPILAVLFVTMLRTL